MRDERIIWDMLNIMFKTTAEVSMHSVLFQYQSIIMEPSGKVMKYVNRIKGMEKTHCCSLSGQCRRKKNVLLSGLHEKIQLPLGSFVLLIVLCWMTLGFL